MLDSFLSFTASQIACILKYEYGLNRPEDEVENIVKKIALDIEKNKFDGEIEDWDAFDHSVLQKCLEYFKIG